MSILSFPAAAAPATADSLSSRPTHYAVVLAPIISPIRANAGEVVTVWPDHPTLTVCVWTTDGSRLLRSAATPTDHVLAGLRALDGVGIVEFRSADGRAVS